MIASEHVGAQHVCSTDGAKQARTAVRCSRQHAHTRARPDKFVRPSLSHTHTPAKKKQSCPTRYNAQVTNQASHPWEGGDRLTARGNPTAPLVTHRAWSYYSVLVKDWGVGIGGATSAFSTTSCLIPHSRHILSESRNPNERKPRCVRQRFEYGHS